MKLKGINNSSKKTIHAIKHAFAELLEEKGAINNITVTELVKRADLTRGAFYSHYDSIYDVAQEIESDLQEIAFSNIKKVSSMNDMYDFIDLMFNYLKDNEELYRKLMQSNDPIMFINRLSKKFSHVFSEIIAAKNEEQEINILFYISGTFSLLVKYYRNEISYSLDTIRDYLKELITILFL